MPLEGINVGGTNISNLRCADDTVLIADSYAKFQSIVNVVVTNSKKDFLSVNLKKTECLDISTENRSYGCILGGAGIKEVSRSNGWKTRHRNKKIDRHDTGTVNERTANILDKI